MFTPSTTLCITLPESMMVLLFFLIPKVSYCKVYGFVHITEFTYVMVEGCVKDVRPCPLQSFEFECKSLEFTLRREWHLMFLLQYKEGIALRWCCTGGRKGHIISETLN